jgi:hypothetical protein
LISEICLEHFETRIPEQKSALAGLRAGSGFSCGYLMMQVESPQVQALIWETDFQPFMKKSFDRLASFTTISVTDVT